MLNAVLVYAFFVFSWATFFALYDAWMRFRAWRSTMILMTIVIPT